MNNPPSESDRHWQEKIDRARADIGPSVDVAALLRAVRQATKRPRPGWLESFAGLFSPQRAVPVCLLAAALITAASSWDTWNVWQALSWGEWMTTGGGL